MRSAAEMSANGGLRNFTMCSDMMVISWCHVEGTVHVYTCVLLKQSETKSRVSDFLCRRRSLNRLNSPPGCWRQNTLLSSVPRLPRAPDASQRLAARPPRPVSAFAAASALSRSRPSAAAGGQLRQYRSQDHSCESAPEFVWPSSGRCQLRPPAQSWSSSGPSRVPAAPCTAWRAGRCRRALPHRERSRLGQLGASSRSSKEAIAISYIHFADTLHAYTSIVKIVGTRGQRAVL